VVNWIRIRESAKMNQNKKKVGKFHVEVLDVLFKGLKASLA
jgi:hypothetical protein